MVIPTSRLRVAMAAACAAVATAPLSFAGPAVAATIAGAYDGAAVDAPAAALAEVVVTANKRAQDLQETPAAVTALSGVSLQEAGIADIRGAQDLVPSVRFQQQNLSTEIYIRGVGSTLDFPQIDPPTAFNLNGVYIPREATSVPLYDVEQLEVLPGPQGTLYGRNTVGGAVNVNFNRPSRTDETSVLAEVGDYSLAHLSATQNLVVSPDWAARLAVDYLDHAGYESSGADSQNDLGARLSVLYDAKGAWSVYLWGSLVTKDGHPPNLVVKGVDSQTGRLKPNAYLNGDPWNDQLPAPYAGYLPFGQPRAEDQHYDNRMFGGEVVLKEVGNATLTWAPSYLSVSTSPNYWLGAFPGNESDNYRQVTNELRANGTESWGTWIAGLYSYALDSNGVFTFGSFTPGTGFPVSTVDFNRIEGEAAFGELTYTVAGRWRVTAGGRYSRDERDGSGTYPDGAAIAPFTYGRSFSHADYKLGLEHDLSDRVLLYAATQTAYQPGTFNAYASTPTASNAVNPATLTAYSAGVKSRGLGGRLQVNDELYYYDYRGLFASAYNTVLNSTQTFNVQRTEIYGDELDILLKPTPADQLSLSFGYLHARYDQFDLPDATANYDGYQLQYAPDWTVNAGYHHDFPCASGYLRASATSHYEDSFYADFSHTPGGRQQPYIKTDASLTYYSLRANWSVGLWVKNIENVAVIAATAGGSNLPPLTTGATAFLEPPRTYGARATVRF
jgi:iron complex outermembrane receptor protein